MANFTPEEISEILAQFFDTVGKRQYIGARYIPIFGRKDEPDITWNNEQPYEPLTIVIYQGNSYTSRKYVPAGIEITNTNYWAMTGNFNAQIEQYRREVSQFDDRIKANKNAIIEESVQREENDERLKIETADKYLPFPNPVSYPKYGSVGQVLSSLGNGLTKWNDPVTVTSEIAGPIIDAWLDEHPEATTTVLDGSITDAKLAPSGILKTVSDLAASIDVSMGRTITTEVSANTLVYVDARIYKGGKYVFSNNTSDTCSCSVEKVDGTKVSLTNVNSNESYEFTAKEDYFKVGGWFNGSGDFTITGTLGLLDLINAEATIEKKQSFIDTVIDNNLQYLNGIDWMLGYITSDGSYISNDEYIRTTHPIRSYGEITISANDGFEFAVLPRNLSGVALARTSMVTEYTLTQDYMYDITMHETTGTVHHVDTSISTNISVATSGIEKQAYIDTRDSVVGIPIDFTYNQNVNCSTAVGQQLDIANSVENVNGYCWSEVDLTNCVGLLLTVHGGSNPRAYCFLDENDIVINKASDGVTLTSAYIPIPNGASKCIINSTAAAVSTCYVMVSESYIPRENALTKDIEKMTDDYLYQLSNIVDYIGLSNFTSRQILVKQPDKYNSWAFVVYVNGILACFYSKGADHFDMDSDVYYKTSVDGVIWSVEKECYVLPNTRINVTGKGYDNDGNALLWFRITNEAKTYFECIKFDGNSFTVMATIDINYSFAHVADIINVGSKLLCFYNTYGTSREYGVLTSTNDGATWSKSVIANGLAATDCPVEIQGVYLGSDKILAIGRKDAWGGTQYQFQLQSGDRGETWTTVYTNIGPTQENTSTLIYDSGTDKLLLWFYDRSTSLTEGYLWEIETTGDTVWNNPTDWPYSSKILLATGNKDGGNANATKFGSKNEIVYYYGTSNNSGIYAMAR